MTERSGDRSPGPAPDAIPELVLAPDDGPVLSNGWMITAAMLGVMAILAIAVGVANLRSDSSSGEVADPEPTAPVEIGPAGPRDGLDSLRLPVSVEPDVDLVDGQVVTVSGSQFPPFTSLGVVMCSGVVEMGGGAAQCQLSPFTQVESDSEGAFTVEYTVRRLIVIGGEVVDCGGPTPEHLDATCVVAVGAISDYDQSGIAPVAFDGSVAPPPLPTLQVSPSEGLVDGDLVTVSVSGATSEWGWWPQLCTNVDTSEWYDTPEGETAPDGAYNEMWCEELGGQWFDQAPPAGPIELPVQRWFGAMSGSLYVDCGEAPGRCWIQVQTGPLPLEPVPISFDPSVPAPPPPPPPVYDEWGHLVVPSTTAGSH
jgi:hypothetical protein